MGAGAPLSRDGDLLERALRGRARMEPVCQRSEGGGLACFFAAFHPRVRQRRRVAVEEAGQSWALLLRQLLAMEPDWDRAAFGGLQAGGKVAAVPVRSSGRAAAAGRLLPDVRAEEALPGRRLGRGELHPVLPHRTGHAGAAGRSLAAFPELRARRGPSRRRASAFIDQRGGLRGTGGGRWSCGRPGHILLGPRLLRQLADLQWTAR
mmetsp:Transcript_107073/g.341096  ORF Transcript_107073/g.341096 Transcript_107073/m.341096 type:complete len:207 (+) Transcript_107073:421-1041(+)